MGKDFTLYARVAGLVQYAKNSHRSKVHVIPRAEWVTPQPVPREAGNRRQRIRLRRDAVQEVRHAAVAAGIAAARQRVREAEAKYCALHGDAAVENGEDGAGNSGGKGEHDAVHKASIGGEDAGDGTEPSSYGGD